MTRSFHLLFIGRTLSSLGAAVIPAALALAVLRATGSTSALALVLAAALVPRLLLLPVGGVFADRFSPRAVALAGDVVRCGTQLWVGLELLAHAPSLTSLTVASAIGGAASAFAWPTTSPLVNGTVSEHARQKANSLMGISRSVTGIAGPALAGVLIFTAGPGWAFILDSAAFAASALLLIAVKARHVPIPKRSMLADLAEGWAEVRRRDWYWSSLIAHGMWNGVASVLITLGPVIAVNRLGGEGVWVVILQAGAIGLLLGSLIAGRARLARPVLVANLGLATYALPLIALAVPGPKWTVIGGYAIAMVALGFLNPVWQTVVQREIPESVLARVSSYDWLLSIGAAPIGFALAPLWDPAAVLYVSAALVAVTCLATAAFPGVRRVTGPAVPDAAQPRADSSPGLSAASRDRTRRRDPDRVEA